MGDAHVQFRTAAGRVAPVVDAALAEFVMTYNLRPVTREDTPPRVMWTIEGEPIVEFTYRAGTSDVAVHDIGLLATLRKRLRSRRVRVEHALADPD